LPTYLSREDPNLAILKPEELFAKTTNREHIHAAAFDDTLWDSIQEARASGVMVLGMGAGAIDGWLREQLSR
jgi:UDP-N-acetylmuramate-alanine ligase